MFLNDALPAVCVRLLLQLHSFRIRGKIIGNPCVRFGDDVMIVWIIVFAVLLAAVLIGLFVPYYIVFYAPHRGADAVQKTGLKEEVLLAELNKIIRNHR